MMRTIHSTFRAVRRKPVRSLPGFSLVEVLMAVLILGLALLGLGAIMPAVVKQQRTGADQTFGTIAGRSVAAWLKGNAALNQPNLSSGNALLRAYGRWEAWARATDSNYSYRIPLDGSWLVMQVEGGNAAQLGRTVVGPLGGNGLNANDQAYINLADRLVPSLSSLTSGSDASLEPQFVVDMAVRRVTPIEPWQVNGSGVLTQERPGNFTLQVAMFTRRVDQRLRTNQGTTVMRALADINTPNANRLWPLSEDTQGNPLGDGANTGGARYSLPFAVNVVFDPATPDRLVVDSVEDSALFGGGTSRANDVAARQMAVSGQTIVDNLGNIYTVQGLDERVNNTLAVRLSTGVPAGIAGSGSGSARRLSQVLVCPQPPAAVNIITVNQ